MISEALIFIRNELRQYLIANKGTLDPQLNQGDIILGNISMLEGQADDTQALANKVVLTLVNLEEESSLKNGRAFLRNPARAGIEYISPPVYLNLYILFTATLGTTGGPDPAYQRSLHRISLIIEFFQLKKSFTVQNSPGAAPGNMTETERDEFQLIPELYTLTFEQINHLWGSLGGKQVPFVLYKMRIVKIQGGITADAPLIEEIQEDGQEQVAEDIDKVERDQKAKEEAQEA